MGKMKQFKGHKKLNNLAYMPKRKYFGAIKGKVYLTPKSVNIHLARQNKNEAIALARAILEAVEYGKSIDIAVPKYIKGKRNQITVTGL